MQTNINKCMHTYINIHTYIHTYMHMHKHAHTHTHTHAHTCSHVHTYKAKVTIYDIKIYSHKKNHYIG